jgi:hypothetical protein
MHLMQQILMQKILNESNESIFKMKALKRRYMTKQDIRANLLFLAVGFAMNVVLIAHYRGIDVGAYLGF